MYATDPTAMLVRYLVLAHDAMRWKLDGLSEYDLRRPLTPTGTNLLGVMKHVAWVELEYFSLVFDRTHPFGESPPRDVPHSDMYATADESVDDIVALFEGAQACAVETIEALELDHHGHVPWWGDANPVSLHWIVVHMTAEIHRHLGHVDILREQLDGLDGPVGHRHGVENLPDFAADDWSAYVAQVEEAARVASER